MQYHNYESLNKTIIEQYSRPIVSNETTNINIGKSANFGFNQGSMMSFLTEGEIGKSLTNFYNVPNSDTFFKLASTTIKPSEEKSKINEDKTKYIYIDASNE